VLIVGNLLVTVPHWSGRENPLFKDLSASAKKYWVDVYDAPSQIYKPSPEALQVKLVRELTDWDEPGDKREVVVVATSRQAAEALGRNVSVLEALEKRSSKLKFAAVGIETAYDFADVLSRFGVAKVSRKDIMTPEVPGRLENLAQELIESVPRGTLAIVLTVAEDRTDFAQKLISGGLRVVRMPVYSAIVQEMGRLPEVKAPWFVLVSASGFVPLLAKELASQGVAFADITWMGPSASEPLVKKSYPSINWISLSGAGADDFVANDILEKIANANE
jgi:uroporphyrinogen-III synthase